MKLVIRAGATESQYWYDLWRYRELFYVLAWRDVTVRYKQTIIGFTWAFLQPILTTAITVFVFGHLAKMNSHGVPYPLLVFAAILPWQFFTNSLTGSGQSLVGNANLISKVYFPRMIMPTSSIVTALIDFSITSVLLVCMMAWYHYWPSPRMLFLPFLLVLAFLTALGPGLLLTALTVRYRDFRFIIPFILQFGLYISPVGYTTDNISDKWRIMFSLNPMVGVIDGFRWVLLGGTNRLYLPSFAISFSVTLAFVFLGIWYFRRMERSFADII
jgi:lipopolysaccharide transport system permease protein